jgi:hypothetical protein
MVIEANDDIRATPSLLARVRHCCATAIGLNASASAKNAAKPGDD